jgi:hypothetical protein
MKVGMDFSVGGWARGDSVAVFAPFARDDGCNTLCVLSSRLLRHTASDLTLSFANMNGVGALPFPAVIWFIDRPPRPNCRAGVCLAI